LTTVEVKVVNTKVSVDMLHLDFVSNIGMDVVEDGNLPGVLTANYYYDRKLSDKHPVSLAVSFIHCLSLRSINGVLLPLVVLHAKPCIMKRNECLTWQLHQDVIRERERNTWRTFVALSQNIL